MSAAPLDDGLFPRAPAVPLIGLEWDDIQHSRGNENPDFPNLNRDECRKTDEDDDLYNCIAWAMGTADEWIEIPGSEEEVDSLCNKGHSPFIKTPALTCDSLALEFALVPER